MRRVGDEVGFLVGPTVGDCSGLNVDGVGELVGDHDCLSAVGPRVGAPVAAVGV